MRIEVDPIAAEILRQATESARLRGETLGTYLSRWLPHVQPSSTTSPCDAWIQFVEGMSDWSRKNLPPGYVADDSRDSIYND